MNNRSSMRAAFRSVWYGVLAFLVLIVIVPCVVNLSTSSGVVVSDFNVIIGLALAGIAICILGICGLCD